MRISGLPVILCCTFLSAGTGCVSVSHETSEPPIAQFDWYEYSGHDAVFERPVGDDQYRNPILSGYYPDPSVVRVGRDYYLVNSTFGFYPGIPVFHSRDLVNWTQIGNAIDRPDMLPYDGIRLGNDGVYAATIEHRDGTFYIMNTCVACGGNFVITATDPAGPWSDPVWLPHIQGIDPSLFFDDDGKAYVVHHGDPPGKRYWAHTAIFVMEVDPETFEARSEDVLLVDGGEEWPWNTDWIEGPHLYKVDGRYFLSAPGGGTGYHHQQLVFRSASPFGPFEPWDKNPILTQHGLPDDRPDPVTATGHADIFEDHTGNWWAVFLGTRVFDLAPPDTDPGNFNTGRETFLLPVHWVDGWPVILDQGKAVPFVVDRPELPKSAPPERPTTGNFTLRDEFDSGELGFDWLFARAPHDAWWTVSDGRLSIEPRDERIGDRGQPSFVGRRLQHMSATITTAIRFVPRDSDEEAGLLAVQNDDHYLAFGLAAVDDGGMVLRVRERSGAEDTSRGDRLLERAVDYKPGEPLYLRIAIDKADIGFYYSRDGENFEMLLGDADAGVLSTATAGGFTGAVIGMYAEGGR